MCYKLLFITEAEMQSLLVQRSDVVRISAGGNWNINIHGTVRILVLLCLSILFNSLKEEGKKGRGEGELCIFEIILN